MEDIEALIADELLRWGNSARKAGAGVSAREAAILVRALKRQDVEIGEIGAACAVIGLLIGKGAADATGKIGGV